MAAAIKLHRHIGRRRAARFLAEGPNLVEAALRRGLVSEVFVTESALSRSGSLLADVPVHVVTEPDAAQAVTALTDAGLQVLATTVDGEVSLDDAALDAPTAWLFGPESHGLPAEFAAMATHRIHIPMPGSAESLNVASAASICLYQSARAHRVAS